MKKGCIALALIIGLVLSGGQLFAQPSEPPPPGEERSMNQEQTEKLRKRIELIWIWKMTEELDLEKEEGVNICLILLSYEERKRELWEENRRLIQELERMIDDGTSESDLKRTISTLEENERKITQIKEEKFNMLKKVLSVEKQAKYIVFQEHFLREIHGLIQKARHRERMPSRP